MIPDTISRLPTTHYPLRTRNSFTLIEILISAALFTGIVVLSVGSFTDSISFNSGANEERAVRQSTRTFIDFLTLQIRQNSATPLYVAKADHVKADGTDASDNFVGTGFLLIDGFNASKLMKLPNLAEGGVATAIIIPTSPDNGGNTWMYIGSPNPTDPLTDTDIGIWKANPIAGSKSKIGLQIGDMIWKEAGDLLPSNVILNKLAFRGISPQGPVYDGAGIITKYSVPAQPYVTIQMQTAPKSNERNVASFETSITSRDYSFAFPSCTNINNNPDEPCQWWRMTEDRRWRIEDEKNTK